MNFSQLSICLRGVMRVGVMTSEITWDGNGINKSDTDAAITELSNYILDASASVKAWASPWGHQWWPPWPRCWSWPRLWSASTWSQGSPSWSAAPPAATLATAWRSIRWWRGRAASGVWRWWAPPGTTAPSQGQPGERQITSRSSRVWALCKYLIRSDYNLIFICGDKIKTLCQDSKLHQPYWELGNKTIICIKPWNKISKLVIV